MQKTDIGTNLLGDHESAPRGIVDPVAAAKRIRLARYACSPELAPFVEFFWLVEWDLRGRPNEVQRTLPFPNCHLVFDRGKTAVYGVMRGAFNRTVSGRGKVLGARFRPGGLRPWINCPVNAITDRTFPVDDILSIDSRSAEEAVLGQPTDIGMVEAAEAILAKVVPHADPRARLAEQAVEAAAVEHGPVSVAALVDKLGATERSLQRLFREYVGVSPKWVIQRFRLQEAVARLNRPEPIALAELAQELGFFDQAHFSTAFTKLIGKTPLAYQRSQVS